LKSKEVRKQKQQEMYHEVSAASNGHMVKMKKEKEHE
jgi:hypothetical protein